MGQNSIFDTNLDYYKAFYYVTKYSSISLAANKLSLTQPSVSNTIKRLENDMGSELFIRTRNGVKLTPAGQVLWGRVEPACALLLAGEEELRAMKTYDGGVLHIAAYELGFLVYVMPALRIFKKDHPNVKVDMISKPIQKMEEMVKSGLADIAIQFSPLGEEDPMLSYCEIDSFTEVFAAGMEFSHLKDRELTLQELCNYPMITYRDGSAKNYLRGAFNARGLMYDTSLEVSSVAMMLQAVVDNYGIGDILPSVAQGVHKEGKLFLLNMKEHLPSRSVLAVTRPKLSDVAELFLKDYLTKYSEVKKE